MILRRAVIAAVFLTGCSSLGPTRPAALEQSTVSRADNSSSYGLSIPSAAEVGTINSLPDEVDAEPTAERVVGVVAIIGGVIAFTILIIAFYKFAKLLAH
jgi:hypothetical protein